MNQLAPIVLFVYNRPVLLKRTIESLKKNFLATESLLYIFADGPKNSDDFENVKLVREYIKNIDGFLDVVIIESETNKGLMKSVYDGVSYVAEKRKKAIVIEDDLEFSEYFLDYQNMALTKYENIEDVMQISGHMFKVNFTSDTPQTFFMPYTTTLGWGVWQRSWRHFDLSLAGFDALSQSKKLRYGFDMQGTYPYFELLERQMQGEVSSWGIIWYLSVFIKQGKILHPRESFVKHIGFDSTATHASHDNHVYADSVCNNRTDFLPDIVKIDDRALRQYIKFFSRSNNLLSKIKRYVESRRDAIRKLTIK